MYVNERSVGLQSIHHTCSNYLLVLTNIESINLFLLFLAVLNAVNVPCHLNHSNQLTVEKSD